LASSVVKTSFAIVERQDISELHTNEEKSVGIRDTLNQKPVVTLIAAFIVIGGALAFIFVPRGPRPARLPTKSYYSDDDGKTWYIDEATNIPPYDHNGKQAVRVYLYKCADGKPFVQRLEEFDDNAKESIELLIKQGARPLEAQLRAIGLKLKKPGDANWIYVKKGIPPEMEAMQRLLNPHCPDGSPTPPVPVTVDEDAKPAQ